MYLKKMRILIQKDTCTAMFIAALFTTAKIWKQFKCPSTDEWKKMWRVCVCVCVCVCTHTHTHTMEYYPAIKKNKILPFAAIWMDLENTMLIEISQRKMNTE